MKVFRCCPNKDQTLADHRLEAIKDWLLTVLDNPAFTIAPASADASFRRYFRVQLEQQSWIVMDAPPEKEDVGPFTRIAEYFVQNNIHVPEILARDDEQGFLLLTDFGSTPYLDKLAPENADQLYREAIEGIIAIQTCPTDDFALPSYDPALLRTELMLFPEWFLGKHLGIPVPDFLAEVFDLLITAALSQPQVIVHRDYHSRNLMVTEQRNPGIIDFQDAVIGAASYDLVSLLKDSYIAWPEQQVLSWVGYYFQQAQQQGIMRSDTEFEQFCYWFDLMGIQRQLKILGIFCRLNYRDGKPNYMADLPQTMQYLRATCARYTALAELSDFLTQLPAIESQ